MFPNRKGKNKMQASDLLIPLIPFGIPIVVYFLIYRKARDKKIKKTILLVIALLALFAAWMAYILSQLDY